jgi:integrase
MKWKDGYRMCKQVNGVRKYFYGTTAKECKQKFELYNGNFGQDVPFCVGFANYLEDYVSTQSKATKTQYEQLAKWYILPIIGNIMLSRILPFNIQTVLTHAKKNDGSPLSKSTLKHIRKVMHAYLEYERKIKKTIRENPSEDVSLPKAPKTRPRRAGTQEELSAIWERMKGTHYYYCFQWLLVTGMRPSEACGLKYSDIKQSKIKVSETRSKYDISDGKTKSATRTLDINPVMLEIINLNKAFLKSEKINSDYIFPTRDGEPSNSGYLSRAWSRLIKDTGIKLTLYELRHGFVSLMIDKLPLSELQRVVGHSSRMDTAHTYAHAVKRDNNSSKIISETMSKMIGKNNESDIIKRG